MASGRRRLLSAVLFVLLPASGFVLLASVFYTLVLPDTGKGPRVGCGTPADPCSPRLRAHEGTRTQ